MSKNATVTRGPGRPAKSVKYPTGAFTLTGLVALNPDVCKLTLRKNVKAGVKSGLLVSTGKVQETGKAGRPAAVFSRASTYNARRANLAKIKAKANVAVSTTAPAPVTPTEPAVATA